MNTSNLVTLDHIKNFFSLASNPEPVDHVISVTGGLGIDNRAEFPPPEPLRPRLRGGTEYAAKYIQEDEDDDFQSPQRQTIDLPGGSTVNLSELNEFENVEELTTSAGDMPAANDLDAERARELYTTYYSTGEVSYNPELPITNFREKILSRVDVNQVVVIQGMTGCGKTTQVPQYILDHHAALGKYCNIVVTQPRKIAAISVARRVCQERNWSMGTIVGYQVAMDNKISADTRLSFVTTGVLLQRLVNSRRMDMYTHVILDEVHERDQDTDFALLVVKKLLRTNSRHVKVILMSATIDALTFAKYFTIPGMGKPAPVIEIEGKAKEVTEHYLGELSSLGVQLPEFDSAVPSLPEVLYDLVVKLMFVFDRIEKSEQGAPSEAEFARYRGAVLIFLPGYEEISTMTIKLEDIVIKRKLTILPLHSSITMEEQTRVFQAPSSGYRKVIISTNIAESSITVPDVKYVIDFCLTKSLVSDPDTNYTCLQLEWASKSNCIQRKGRAGRVHTGRVYRMVPFKFYEQLNEYCVPEIKRCPLQQTVLFTKKLDFGEPQALLALALDPPELTDIEKSILSLKEVGALAITVGGKFTPFDGDLTFVGRVMSNLPLDVYISKLIILGYVFNCLEDCLIIAASLSLKSFLSRPFRKMLDAYKSRLSWAEGTFSDCFSYLHAYRVWKNLSQQGRFKNPSHEISWGQSNFVQIKRVKEVDMLVSELERRLETANIRINYHRTIKDENVETQILKIVIAGAFYPNYFVQDTLDEKIVLREVNNNDPLSTVVLTGLPANQGLLYAYPIREMLWGCSTQMKIDFEERKAYVSFIDSTLQENTKISQAVYLAVKMRMLRLPMELQLFNAKDAERKIIQLRAMKGDSGEKKLHTNRMSFQSKSAPVEQVPLPSIRTLTIKISVVHIIDCGHFWARYCDQQYHTILAMLGEMINSNDGKNMRPLNEPLKPGMLVLAPYKDMAQILYYRARVDEMNIKEGRVTVFFIDYGNTVTVPIQDLRLMDKDLAADVLTTPAMAFECQLCEVRPSAAFSSTGTWSKKATRFFTDSVNGVPLTARVYSVVQNIVRLELYREDPFRNINSELIRLKYGEPAEETLVSKQNNALRLESEQQLSSGGGAAGDLGEYKGDVWQYSMEETTDLKDLAKSNRKIRLQGPFSPLEVKYQGMTRLSSFRSVNIDRDSVNSVSLNPEPQDMDGQMLIGCHVGLNPNGSSLSVRNTTLMPKIRSLPALLCLLFSPCAELRCDATRTRYTGALCGLGCDPESGESLYPEHEIELVFESVIDLSDIRNINKVRMGVNIMLGIDGEQVSQPMNNLRDIQKSLRDTVMELLCKCRGTCNPLPSTHKYCWQQIPTEYLLCPGELKNMEVLDIRHILLPLHNAINLKNDNSLMQEIHKNLTELYAVAKKSSRERIHAECKLCSLTFYSPRDLKIHLETDQHRGKENNLLGLERPSASGSV